MQKLPNNIKRTKSYKIKTYKGLKGSQLSFFKSGLKTKNKNYLSWNNFEAFRKVFIRAFRTKEIKNKKNFKLIQSSKKKKKKKRELKKKINSLIFKAHFWSPITKKPLQVRMGKGKGSVYKWVFPCGSKRILMEQLTTIRRKKIKRVFNKACNKMPVSFKYVINKQKQIFPRRLKNEYFKPKGSFNLKEIIYNKFNSNLNINKTNEQ